MYGLHVRARAGGVGAVRACLPLPRLRKADAPLPNLQARGAETAKVVHLASKEKGGWGFARHCRSSFDAVLLPKRKIVTPLHATLTRTVRLEYHPRDHASRVHVPVRAPRHAGGLATAQTGAGLRDALREALLPHRLRWWSGTIVSLGFEVEGGGGLRAAGNRSRTRSGVSP